MPRAFIRSFRVNHWVNSVWQNLKSFEFPSHFVRSSGRLPIHLSQFQFKISKRSHILGIHLAIPFTEKRFSPNCCECFDINLSIWLNHENVFKRTLSLCVKEEVLQISGLTWCVLTIFAHLDFRVYFCKTLPAFAFLFDFEMVPPYYSESQVLARILGSDQSVGQGSPSSSILLARYFHRIWTKK